MKIALLFSVLLCSIPVRADFQYRSSVSAAASRQITTVALQGGRMLRKGATHTEIVDVDKRTITTIDATKRAWSVMTFDQFRKAVDAAGPSAAGAQPALDMSAAIRATGQSRTINGYPTKESVVTMSTAGLSFDMRIWIAPEVPGYSEVRDFYRRLAKDFDWLPSTAALRDRTGIARLAGRLISQSGLLDGTPIETVIAIRSGGQSSGAAPPMEMTVENSGFSSAPVDPALFEIPAGFTESPSGQPAAR